ncbi:MAG: DUF2330 domain-containing protein [Myxococcota bacterium]
MVRLTAVFCLVFAVLVAPAALACGGLFCSVPQGPVPPQPIDQNAERIIFDVDGDTVTTHVQIQYAGAADAFAWVVPVGGVPTVVESSADLFSDLESATAVQVTLPQPEACPQFASSGSGGGFACAADSTAGGVNFENDRGGPAAKSPVTVFAHDFTDNYEYTVVGAEQTTVLVKWLQENGYNVSDNMAPVIAPYNGDAGAKFLALKLRGGKVASDIVPIAMTYPSKMPVIPLRLTAVAAQPLMGVLVFITADRHYAPDNWTFIEPNADEILFDDTGATSYFEWVARSNDEAGGHQFVREFRGFNPLEGLKYGTDNVQLRGAKLTRFYARLGPHQMDADPFFVPDDTPEQGGNAAVFGQRVLDFSARTTLWSCGAVPIAERLPSPCAFNYCGAGATCTVMDGRVGCACPTGSTAQRITGPDGSDHVTCAPTANPFGITDEAGGVGGSFDPCASYPCGSGKCVLKGGFPTCACSGGAVACLEPGGLLSCVAVGAGATTFGPGAGTESAAPKSAMAAPPADSRFAVTLWPPLALVLIGLAYWRRRVRARAHLAA